MKRREFLSITGLAVGLSGCVGGEIEYGEPLTESVSESGVFDSVDVDQTESGSVRVSVELEATPKTTIKKCNWSAATRSTQCNKHREPVTIEYVEMEISDGEESESVYEVLPSTTESGVYEFTYPSENEKFVTVLATVKREKTGGLLGDVYIKMKVSPGGDTYVVENGTRLKDGFKL